MAEGSGDIPLKDIVTNQPNIKDTAFADNLSGDPKDQPRLSRLRPLESKVCDTPNIATNISDNSK